ncbi:MAG: hypothetical protein AAF321_09065, partial [Pseudomonadota bacterium]
MVGVSALNYRESLFRQDTAMLRHLERLDELRGANLARSALMAQSLAAASARGAEACQAEMDRLSARVIWRSATLYDAAGATDCTFRAPNP